MKDNAWRSARRSCSIDDLDDTELEDGKGQTLSFSIGSNSYEIDLGDDNLGKFYDALQPYVEKARRVGGRRTASASSPRASSTKTDPEQLQAMRAWANENGYKVSSRGRVSREVQDAYNAAQ